MTDVDFHYKVDAPFDNKRGFLERMFDEHTDGRFVKYLLVVMLLIASITQPFSIIYTAYGDKLPSSLWEAVPMMAFLLFIALDWTILPLGYFFSTTAKPSIKIVTAALLVVVAFGAFEGYFTATERLISMRAKEITKLQLAVAEADAKRETALDERKEKQRQQDADRAVIETNKDALEADGKRIADQIDRDQATLANEGDNHQKLMDSIGKTCLAIRGDCLVAKQNSEEQRYNTIAANLKHELDQLHQEKQANDAKLSELDKNSDSKVSAANQDVDAAQKASNAAHDEFDVAVTNNQLYRWAGVIYHKSPRSVSADQANRVLFIFAASVALAYVLTQIVLSIAFYGRHRRGFVETHKVSWKPVIDAIRRYWIRKRRPVYRTVVKEVPTTVYQDREVVKEVMVPIAERTKIIHVPVPMGGPIPPNVEHVHHNRF